MVGIEGWEEFFFYFLVPFPDSGNESFQNLLYLNMKEVNVWEKIMEYSMNCPEGLTI